MTIDEAIISFEKVAEYNESAAKRFNGVGGKAVEKYCEECKQVATEHRQLAEWLMEYKDLKAEQNEQYVFIRELMSELKKAKRLLGEALRTLNDSSCSKDCRQCKWNNNGCEMSCRFAWKYGDEASALIGDENDDD